MGLRQRHVRSSKDWHSELRQYYVFCIHQTDEHATTFLGERGVLFSSATQIGTKCYPEYML
jgi:hypothetical protein